MKKDCTIYMKETKSAYKLRRSAPLFTLVQISDFRLTHLNFVSHSDCYSGTTTIEAAKIA